MFQSKSPLYGIFVFYLRALEEEGIPDVQVGVDGETVDEEAEEPVDGEQGRVHTVAL